MQTIVRFLPSCAIVALAIAGCSASPDDDGGASTTKPDESELRSAMQTYFDAHRECAPFFDMPAVVRIEPDSYRIGQLDVFAAAGLVQRIGDITKPDEVTAAPQRFARYAVTPLGRQSIQRDDSSSRADKMLICYGRRKVDTVSTGGTAEFTPDRLSVTYGYSFVDIPAWTRAASIQKLYPSLAERLSEGPKSDGEELRLVGGKWTLPKQTAFTAYNFRRDSL